MRHLEIPDELPEGFDLLDTQRALQKRLWDKGCYDYMPHVRAETEADLLTSIRFNDEAINAERQEVYDRLPWKRWKADHRERMLGSQIDPEVRFELMFELIDELHFLANKMMSAGFRSWDEVERWYLAKNKENLDRQDRGY